MRKIQNFVELPAALDVPVRYLESPGYILGMLAGKEGYSDLLYCNFLQIESRYGVDNESDHLNFRFFPHTSIPNWEKQGVIAVEDVSNELLSADFDFFANTIKTSLSKELYLVVELECRSLKFKPHYGKRSCLHKCLIVGCKTEEAFLFVGYGSKGWGKYEVSRGELKDSFYAGKDKYADLSRPIAQVIEAREIPIVENSVAAIVEGMADYLNQPSVQDYHEHIQMRSDAARYGIEVECDYLKYYRDLANNDIVADPRKTRLLLEFSSLTKKRVSYLEDKLRIVFGAQVSEQLDECMKSSRKLHYDMSLLWAGKFKSLNLERQTAAIKEFFKNSKSSLSEVVSALRPYVQG